MQLCRLRLRRQLSNCVALLIATTTLGVSSLATAAAPTPQAWAKARASGGQPELLVGFDATGKLIAQIAGSSKRITLSVPESLLLNRDKSQIDIVPIGEQRHAMVVTIPTELPTRPWQALIVAKPGKDEPETLFEGFTGFVEGEDGMRRGPSLEISEAIDDNGNRRIVLGVTQEDLTLCGRPATLSPKMLSPKDLTLRPAKLQRLRADERESAVTLLAEPHAPQTQTPTLTPSDVTAPSKPAPAALAPAAASAKNTKAEEPTPSAAATGQLGGQASLLRALGATSAIGWPASLTDGNLETTWAENRGGAGRGEFVTFKAPSDVPLQGFDFVVRPPLRDIPKGVGPLQLWLVTNKQLYAIRFPTDPWKGPGVSWHVKLPTPVQTDCVAIVTESAYGEKPDSEVTLAEVRADSEFASANVEQLVGALAGGGPRADAASSVLSALGPEAQRAVADAFDKLDEGGKRAALDVLDHGPCAESSRVYIKALLGSVEAHRLHAIDRLHRCGPEVVAPIEQALGDKPTASMRALLELFAEIAPERAIASITPKLVGNVKTRRMLREVLTLATRSARAPEAIRATLTRHDLPKQAFIDFLRSLGPRLGDYADVAVAPVETLLRGEADWKMRYLLLSPAHALAKNSKTLASALSAIIRTDPNANVRAEALRAVDKADTFAADIYTAMADPEVRVRQAATEVLGRYHHPSTQPALLLRLKQDSWPMVRAAAAESLGSQTSSVEADKALISALSDDAWTVRVAVAEALGNRSNRVGGEALLNRFEDKKERFEVRVAVANSLGQICYEPAIDSLSEQAKKLKSAGMDMRDRSISASALSALGQLHPPNLAKILDPLLTNKDVPAEIRQAAQAALSNPSHCQLPKAPATAEN